MRSPLPALALVGAADCLGGPTGDGPPTDRDANDARTTPDASTTPATTVDGTAELTCSLDRDAVERRADRAYRSRYGKLGVDLYEHLRSVAAGERVAIRVAVSDVDRHAARAAVNDSLNATAYRRALEAEIERRVDRKTAAVVRALREMDGVAVEHEGSLVVVVTATPAAIEQIERVDAVERITLRRTGTTTRLPRGGDE